MNPKTYFKTTGTIFLIVAVIHLVRAVNGWEVNLHTLNLPLGVSWVGFLIASYLAYQGLVKK